MILSITHIPATIKILVLLIAVIFPTGIFSYLSRKASEKPVKFFLTYFLVGAILAGILLLIVYSVSPDDKELAIVSSFVVGFFYCAIGIVLVLRS